MEYRPKPQQPSVVQPISAASPDPLLDATHTTKPATDIPSTSEPAVMESHPTSVETHGILEDDVDIPTTVLTSVTHPDTADNALVSQEVPSQALVVQEIGFAPVTVMETEDPRLSTSKPDPPYLLPIQIRDDCLFRRSAAGPTLHGKSRDELVRELKDFAAPLLHQPQQEDSEPAPLDPQIGDDWEPVIKRKRGRPPKNPTPLLQLTKAKATSRSSTSLSQQV